MVTRSRGGSRTQKKSNSRLTNIALPLATVALVVGQAVTLIQRTRAAAAEGDATEQAAILGIVSGSIWGLLLAIGVVAYLRIPALTRERALQKLFPSAVVVTATRTRALKVAFRVSGDTLPNIFSLLATAKGLEVRTTADPGPATWALDWESVLSVSIDQVDGGSRTFQALVAEVRTSAGPVSLPFVVTGGGLFGLFELRHEQMVELLDRIDEVWDKGRLERE